MKLSSEERTRIHAATAKAEAESAARFAVVILPASDRYQLYPLAWGAALALIVGAILALVRHNLSLRHGILIEAAVFAVFALAFDWLPLRLLLVSKHARQDHARKFAHREFAARILSPHDHREGILFFVSLAERYVEILATRDIHIKVGDAAWNAVIADFTSAAKAGRIADGIIAAVENCASQLSPHSAKAL